MGTYDFAIPRANSFYDLSSGDRIQYTSESKFSKCSSLCCSVKCANGHQYLYMGVGPIVYYGWLTKTITEKNETTNTIKTDIDEYKGIGAGICYMIGIQRSINETLSFSANILFQTGASRLRRPDTKL